LDTAEVLAFFKEGYGSWVFEYLGFLGAKIPLERGFPKEGV